jgi:O-succinylbenzoic acid--CoA ligase
MSEKVTQVPCPLRATANAAPDSPAIVRVDGALSYGELDRRVSAASARLEDLGLKSGARVAVYLDKDERYFVLLLALIRARCVACPISTRMPVAGMTPLLRKAGCRAVISDRELPDIVGVGALRPEDVLESGLFGEEDMRELRLSLDQPATIVFTSGSTGMPKAAFHTLGNHYYSALGSNANLPLSSGDRWLHSLPLYHVGGISIFFRCLIAGASIALPEREESPGEAIFRHGATHVSLVATQLKRLLEEGAGPGSLKAVLMGGSAIPPALLEEAATRGLPVRTSYGLTEMASQVTTTTGDPGELRTSGKALPYREVRVSEDGEVLVRGETLFAGYIEGDELDRPLDTGGWFHTKDLGEIDAASYLRVWGRKDNLFISGGENIQPEEVEEVLRRLSGVEDAVVVPVPDDEFGFRPVAFIRTTGGVALPEGIEEILERSLPRFKIPVAFHGWPEDAPAGMKVDRRYFRERARKLRSGGR